MVRIKRCRSNEEELITDDIQELNSGAENLKKQKETKDRALDIQSGNDEVDSVAQIRNYLEGHKDEDFVEKKEGENPETAPIKKIRSKKGNNHFDPSDFAIGDVVWAKCTTSSAAWPAVVIDPTCEAPPAVLKAIAHGALCVMFYGHTKSKQREYGWIKSGKVFPFDSYMDRFKGQTKLNGRKLSDFQLAIGEGIAAVSTYVGTRSILNSESSSLVDQSSSESKQLCGGSNQTRLLNNLEQNVVPHKTISVMCNSVRGIYDSVLNSVGCTCAASSCNGKKYTLNAWEKHTGCRAKKWRISVRVHDSNLSLSDWIIENVANGSSGNERQLFALLEENYKPVHVRWTPERCVVCKCVEDYDYNKIIICNRCQIGVHQECYGVNGPRDFDSWICRACETPQIKKECCLCPVKGGALKPTDIESLWVHVTCAWSRPEIAITDAEKMEPAIGIMTIPTNLFTKTCVICKQVHGACIQCCKCTTYFHATCASLAGYCMELHCCNKENGKEITNWISYCALHGAPRADNVLVFKTPDPISQNELHEECSNGSRTITALNTPKPSDSLSADGYEFEDMSAARCRIYKRPNIKRTRKDSVVHRLTGLSHHSLDDIRRLNLHKDTKDGTNDLCTLKTHLKYLKGTDYYHVYFGQSKINGWGIFARRSILNGEMIMEYRGEQVRRIIADRRDTKYKLEGKNCYFFKINEEIVIDATNKGNISRLLNHSCMPNCCARIVCDGNEDNRIVLIALSDISIDEEITCNYMSADSDKPEEANTLCTCNALTCKKFLK